MGSIDRYIFRTTFSAFLVVLVCLTAVIWITQALRDLDLMTSQGQTILVFVGITGLIIPLLILVIAPIALVMAVVHVLNKLSTDSELIVMNAAGMSPLVLFRSFLMVVVAVSVLVAFVSAYLAPKGLRELREWITQVRADVVANIVQPGRFTGIERGVVFHIRERQPNGVLRGIFVDDQRNPKERITMLAEQGTIVKNDEGTFLVLENGSIQRQEQGERDPTIVMYDRHAFDLSRFGGSGPQTITYSPRERYLWELLSPAPDDPVYRQQPQQFRAELHERLTGLLYPIVFVIVAYAYLGPPRTTRQSRGRRDGGSPAGLRLQRAEPALCGSGAGTLRATVRDGGARRPRHRQGSGDRTAGLCHEFHQCRHGAPAAAQRCDVRRRCSA
jgi:lipopolysaccharide export system permease protein